MGEASHPGPLLVTKRTIEEVPSVAVFATAIRRRTNEEVVVDEVMAAEPAQRESVGGLGGVENSVEDILDDLFDPTQVLESVGFTWRPYQAVCGFKAWFHLSL